MNDLEQIFDGVPTEPTETPAEETPAEEATAEETPAKETPAEEKPNEVVEELVEGKTQEAKESTEKELAEAVLEETAPKDMVPLAKYMAEKNARRDAEDRATRAEGAAEALKQPVEKKPCSVQDMIEAGRLQEDDVVPAGIWAEIEANKAKAAQETTEPKTGREEFLSKAAKSEETMIAETADIEGLDFKTVTEAGKGNLSVKDQAEIVRSDDPCRTLYDRCIERTPALAKIKANPVAKTTETKSVQEKKEPKNTPIPKRSAAPNQAAADDEEDFFEAEMAKSDDQQLKEIRELTNVPGTAD